MANRQGDLVWTELMSADPDRAMAWYGSVAGFYFAPAMDSHGGYRQFGGVSGHVGGLLPLTTEMQAGGAQPGWLPYFAADDTDRFVERHKAAGGGVTMPPWDIDGVGRVALLTDPWGGTFYVLHGPDEYESHAFSPDAMGKCCWLELGVPDADAALAFYGGLFGWTHGGEMPMPPEMQARYAFLVHGETVFGAVFSGADAHPGWRLYFTVPDADALPPLIEAGGGRVDGEVMDVPGGSRVVSAWDAEGALTGFASPTGSMDAMA